MKVLLVVMDHQRGVTTLWRSDGKCAEMQFGAVKNSPLSKSQFQPGVPYLILSTVRGEDILLELPTIEDASPLRGRPVIYLDQNAWSTIATAHHAPERLKPTEVEAARWLAGLAREWRVVLPYSAGTLTETSHWSNDERRYQLALTIFELSRGWQMLDPLALRAAEMRWILGRAIGKTGHPLPQAWTLAPDAVFGDRIESLRDDNDEALDAESRMQLNAITSLSATVSAILDRESIQRSDQDEWAQRWAGLADYVRNTQKPRHLTEAVVHGAILADARDELAQAAMAVGISMDQASEWLSCKARTDIARMPAFGLAREVTYLKVSNNTARWQANDLQDIFHLVQASGYADAVVGERGFSALTRSAQKRMERKVNAYSSIAQLRQSNTFRDTPPEAPTVV
jgi:hypothetical protein